MVGSQGHHVQFQSYRLSDIADLCLHFWDKRAPGLTVSSKHFVNNLALSYEVK